MFMYVTIGGKTIVIKWKSVRDILGSEDCWEIGDKKRKGK